MGRLSVIVARFRGALRRDGVSRTIAKIARYPFRPLRKRRLKDGWSRALAMSNVEDRFLAIYRGNLWENLESSSGIASTLWYSEPLRRELPPLVAQFAVKSIFDAPCGDFNWMRHVLPALNVTYTGGDIVRPLIERLDAKHRTDRVSFTHINLIADPFPNADLMICRDCLPHLSWADTRRVLENFVASGIRYLLTTSHAMRPGFSNQDITTGHFRMIDVFSPPYNLPQGYLARIADWVAPEPERYMYLWDREQVSQALARFGSDRRTPVS